MYETWIAALNKLATNQLSSLALVLCSVRAGTYATQTYLPVGAGADLQNTRFYDIVNRRHSNALGRALWSQTGIYQELVKYSCNT